MFAISFCSERVLLIIVSFSKWKFIRTQLPQWFRHRLPCWLCPAVADIRDPGQRKPIKDTENDWRCQHNRVVSTDRRFLIRHPCDGGRLVNGFGHKVFAPPMGATQRAVWSLSTYGLRCGAISVSSAADIGTRCYSTSARVY
uniref:Secreted protein n=1 Tax=Romanomermis culicivorax TaxID=13658 RepID=A0A915JWB6_ROMCU